MKDEKLVREKRSQLGVVLHRKGVTQGVTPIFGVWSMNNGN